MTSCIASLHLSALPAHDSSSRPFVENRSTGRVGSWPKRRKNGENPVYSCTIALFKCYFQFDFWASSGMHNISISVLLKRSAGWLGWETNSVHVLILFTSTLCCLYRAFPMDSTTSWWHYSVHSCMFFSMDFGLQKRKSASWCADLRLDFRVNPSSSSSVSQCCPVALSFPDLVTYVSRLLSLYTIKWGAWNRLSRKRSITANFSPRNSNMPG